MSFSKKIKANLSGLKKHPAVQRFIQHNKQVFPVNNAGGRKGSVVLLELNAMQSAHIAHSYLANVLAELHEATIKAYAPYPLLTVRERLMFRLRALLGINEFGVYQSFGTAEIFRISPSRTQKERANALFEAVKDTLNSKLAVEALTINGIWVGDLIYDTYLRSFNEATIDPKSPRFLEFLRTSLELFVFWEDYFNNNDVRAVCVSHTGYNLAMPLRVAVGKNIPVFQASLTHLYRLSRDKLFAYTEFFHFREDFAALPAAVRESGLAEAQKRIERRFAGEVGVDMAYSTKSAYGEARHRRLLCESPRKKILIATHCFFDSPHGYGNNLFPDFYEWLDFLGKITETTDYDWYIKTHPDYLPGTMEIIRSFVERYPKFTLLPSDASHHQIIAEGIDLALTVYGTIAFEYAALGIPVINASLNNPHIAYHFNLHARDVEEYRRLLTGLNSLDLTIDRAEVLEYYYMRYIRDTVDLFFNSHKQMIDDLGGYDAQFSPLVYEKWLAEWNPAKHGVISDDIRAFVSSGNFRMDRSAVIISPKISQADSVTKGPTVGSGLYDK